jgi:hypothetical protein
MSTSIRRTTQEALDALGRLLRERQQQRDPDMYVPEAAWVEDGEYLTIAVQPVQEGIRAYDYVQELDKIERELHEAGFTNVILVPAIVDD